MPHSKRATQLIFSLIASIALPSGVIAQEIDLGEIFSNDRFFTENDILRTRGDVGFVADVWTLPAGEGATRALIGISLSNSSLQFVRTTDGQWQADYRVDAQFEPADGGETIDRRWEKTVAVSSFDETLLSSETIVFQAEVPLAVGEYEVALIVRDLNADKAERVTTELVVDGAPATPTVSEPVLLRLYETTDRGVDYIVSPSHYYPSAPDRFDFMLELDGVGSGGPFTAHARLVPAEGATGSAATDWTRTITVEEDGTSRLFGSLQNDDARFGEFSFEVEVVNAAGETVDASATPLLISGSGGWIAENWDDAISLIRWEATDDELDILEDVEGDEARIQAWNCFWRMRDPVPATATNEALIEYFRKIAIANREWRSSLRPGFLSDRGRVFVTLGAPDNVVERPVPSGSAAFEVWEYYRYNFQIVFVDRIGFNNYQLESINTYQRELATIERRKKRFLSERAGQCPLLKPAYE